MGDYKQLCSYCNQSITGHHFLEHILRFHPLEMLEERNNILHLRKQTEKPFRLTLESSKGVSSERYYYCCLGCQRATKKQAQAEKHFPRCREKHQEKIKELLLLWKQHVKELENKGQEEEETVIVKNVGWSQEDIYALIGAFVEHHNNSKWDEEFNKAKLFAYEEEVKDLVVLVEQYQEEGLERVIEHIEDKANEASDDIEVEKDKPSDITALFNICQKLKLKIDDEAIKKAYEKVKNQPTKKPKEK